MTRSEYRSNFRDRRRAVAATKAARLDIRPTALLSRTRLASLSSTTAPRFGRKLSVDLPYSHREISSVVWAQVELQAVVYWHR